MDPSLVLLQPIRDSEKTYVVIVCPKCQLPLMAKADQEKRGCPHCGMKINLRQARVFRRTTDPEDARDFLGELRRSCSI
mgnify:FL=1